MAVVDFSGTWKHEKDENFENFLKAIGVNIVKRKIVASLGPTLIIEQNGNRIKFVTKTSLSTHEAILVIGEENIQKDILDERVEHRVKDYMDGDKLVSEVVEGNGMIISRELVGDRMIISHFKDDVNGIRTFKKVQEK